MSLALAPAPTEAPPAAQNRLIGSLPRREQQRLLAHCESVDLVLSQVLCERGQPTRAVYFPVGGFISLVAQLDHHPGVEVGMVGREGMLGAPLALGVAPAPWRALVQGPGAAWRLSDTAFAQALADSPPLRRCVERYLYVLMAQLAASAACLRFHLIGPRLARWLLMSQDRAHAERFRVTHEVLAYMLGVRRAGITLAALSLQRRGLITYHRGDLVVLDRNGLLAAACSCYAHDARVYADHIDPV